MSRSSGAPEGQSACRGCEGSGVQFTGTGSRIREVVCDECEGTGWTTCEECGWRHAPNPSVESDDACRDAVIEHAEEWME